MFYVFAIHHFLLAIHKKRETKKQVLCIKNKKTCYLAGKKPAGAHPGAQSLESTCFMYLRHKNQDSMYQK